MTYAEFLRTLTTDSTPEAHLRTLTPLWRRYLRWGLAAGLVVQVGVGDGRGFAIRDTSMSDAIAPEDAGNVEACP